MDVAYMDLLPTQAWIYLKGSGCVFDVLYVQQENIHVHTLLVPMTAKNSCCQSVCEPIIQTTHVQYVRIHVYAQYVYCN